MASLLNNQSNKRELGAFFTKGNPFTLEPFKSWLASAEPTGCILEPFAGAASIPRLLHQAGFEKDWQMYDISPCHDEVKPRDSLKQFPVGFKCVISNPPYLSYHFAKRKGLAVEIADFRGYASLYLVAIEECLKSSPYVGLIVPESFITSGHHRERLVRVISLSELTMFADTTMPTCLALWAPDSTTTEYWVGDRYIGELSALESVCQWNSKSPHRIRFNVVDGNIGIWAIDDTRGPSIRFCKPDEIPVEKIKVSARLVSRILVSGLSEADVPRVIQTANEILNEWRTNTADVLLTAFKGPRLDGKFRRRIDYKNARGILRRAVDLVEVNTSKQMEFEI
jgi:hypothetical protein